jgi:hypothetical protein
MACRPIGLVVAVILGAAAIAPALAAEQAPKAMNALPSSSPTMGQPSAAPAPGPMQGPPPEYPPPTTGGTLMDRLAGQWRIKELKPAMTGNLAVNYVLVLRPQGTYNVFFDMSGGTIFPFQMWGTYSAAMQGDLITLRMKVAGSRPDKICDPLGLLSGHNDMCSPANFGQKEQLLRVRLNADGTMESEGAIWQRLPLP